MAAVTTRATSAQPEEIAHILRRCTFGPFPGAVQKLVDEGITASDLIGRLIDAPSLTFDPPGDIDGPYETDDKALEFTELVPWWVERMRSDDAVLHERMMWFWHNHFTTNRDRANDVMCWRQLRLFHAHALGNFRDLTQEITIDSAMLRYLDGDGSRATEPNENYARELMELFTLGRNEYTQSDVEAASKALAGWGLNWEEGTVEQRPDARMRWPVTLFGDTAMYGPAGVVDKVLDQPSCAPFIVAKLWDSFIGGVRDPALIATWADGFRDDDYEIRPLMQTLLGSEAFRTARMSRPRSTLEWFIPMTRILHLDDYGPWDLENLGHMPYGPPNVAGWPTERWTSSSTMLSRASYLSWFEISQPDEVSDLGRQVAAADAVLKACSVFEADDATVAALRQLHRSLAQNDVDDFDIGFNLLRATLLSPEFSLA